MAAKVHMLVTGNDAVAATSRHELLGVDLEREVDKRPFGWVDELPFGPDSRPGLTSPVTMFYIEGTSDRILVDTGYDPTDDSPSGAKAALAKHGIPMWMEVRDEWSVDAQLAKVGVTPEQIDLVIHTHLHFDHIGNNMRFPNARFVAQRSEMEYAVRPAPWTPFYYEEMAHNILDLGDRLELIDGDTRVNDDVALALVGGHTPGSQVVLVETDAGRVCLPGDLCYYYRNLELDWPGGTFFDLQAVMRSYGWMRRNADVIVPPHDWKFCELHPQGWVG